MKKINLTCAHAIVKYLIAQKILINEKKEPLFPAVYEVPILIDKYDGQEYEEGDEYIYWSN